MQNIALARTGRLGIDRDILAAIYVALRFYRLKQQLDVSNTDAIAEFGTLLADGAIPTSPSDLESAIARELAEAVAHSHPDSSQAAILKLVAQFVGR